jgi:phosphatidylinositol alpha-1,6-mannosyltransferase
VLPTIQQGFLQARDLLRLGATLATIIRKRQPDVELVHSLEAYPTGLLGHWLALTWGKPHVLTAHGTYAILPYNRFPDRLLYGWVLRRASALCPVSPGAADMIRRYFPKDVANTYVRPILNGNDYYKMIPRQEAFHRLLPATPMILSVGAVKPRKGYDLSLRAFARLKEILPTARYRIVGNIDNRKYHRELLEYIGTHKLADVELAGAVSQERLSQYYREASVFLLTPREADLHFEGFGLVYLEAGAFGLPVIGTRTGGVPDAILHRQTGFVLDPGDIDGIVEALYCLLTDPELTRRMGRANREWAETLTWERYAREQREVYQEVLASRQRRAQASTRGAKG